MNTISEESFHSSSVASDGSTKKKKGLKKLGSSLKNVFGGKKRRRRRKQQGQGDDNRSYSSYDHSDTGDSAIYSYQEVGSVSSRDSAQQDLWLKGQQQQPQNSVGGRGMSLSKITEHENEDNSSVEAEASRSRRNPNRYYPGRSNGTPKKASGRRSRKNQAVPSDPLSLVVLLVDPTSLRFELLSLDFDLEGSTTLKRQADAVPELTLTVQDVLDQITPDSITDEKLREAFASNQCQGLIDRAGKVHFGSASLEIACASRPLRPIDKAMEMRSRALARKDDDASRRNSAAKRESLLAIPTYGGDPHRDILLGFFGSKSSETASEVNKTLELSKPIFADANVVGLLEQNGYDLSGWKPGTSVPNREDEQDIRAKRLAQTKTSTTSARALLLPQQPSKRRRKFNIDHPLVKLVLAIVAVALATILALAIVTGGLNLIPAVDGESLSSWETPQTVEGYLKMGFDSLWDWYFVTEKPITER